MMFQKSFIKIVLLAVATFGLGVSVSAQTAFDLTNYGVRIEADKRLITVLATLEMAQSTDASGKTTKLINTPLSTSGQAFRARLTEDFAGLPADLRTKITAFVLQYKKQHAKQTDAQIVSPFISMAYTLSPAPEMADPTITSDLPGNLLDVLDFAPLAREFYRRSGISSKLDEYIKLYRTEADGVLRVSAREMVGDLLDYLHTRPELYYTEKVTVETSAGNSKKTKLQKVEVRDHERRFMLVPEMLAPAGNVNFLNIKDDYYVVLPPDKDVSFSEVRRAYLQFVIDPLVLKNSKDVVLIRDGVKALLAERRKEDPTISPDVFLTISRSLIAAADAMQEEQLKSSIATDQARQRITQVKSEEDKLKVSAELKRVQEELADERLARLSEDYEHGAVLAFYFAEQLKGTQDSGFDIASSMREMIANCDPLKEKDRLTQYADARKRAIAVRTSRKTTPGSSVVVAENPVTNRLLEIQKIIAAKDYAKAGSDLKELQAKYPSEPRIYYSIGRLASLTAETLDDPEAQAAKLLEAKVAYSNVIRTRNKDTEAALLSLTFVALARIYEFSDENDYAIKLYDEAIKLDDVAGGAFRDAIAGKQKLLKKQ